MRRFLAETYFTNIEKCFFLPKTSPIWIIFFTGVSKCFASNLDLYIILPSNSSHAFQILRFLNFAIQIAQGEGEIINIILIVLAYIYFRLRTSLNTTHVWCDRIATQLYIRSLSASNNCPYITSIYGTPEQTLECRVKQGPFIYYYEGLVRQVRV